MLPTLVIFFRESLEASLLVGIILAYLQRIGRPDRARPVWAGVGAALVIDLVVALLTYHLIRQYDGSRMQTILEGATYLLAAAVLTGMSFWMQGRNRDWKRALEQQVAAALDRGPVLALALLAALTVGREGLETVFFTLAIAFTAPPPALAAGAATGLMLGLGVTAAVYRLGRRVPLRLFFQGLGLLLLVFAAGLLADGIEDFQSLGWLPFLRTAIWHSGAWLNENSTLGDLLHSFFGYAQAPSLLQAGAYVIFLTWTVTRYLRGAGSSRPLRRSPPA
ncbi:Ferrous iron transport permease EfeU [Candidatus Hydrogenisulfobacillus filiaventi]|uniref:Ferrous iron transport permease EfeU n=1 Tax=Candidatus Hydrogenisulfobacillus filiaventi TaxID=2707344 RepID=A0A6F8ZG39_9FIRM|nr:FTR1 family protein [Bacillota bacterium]CAB1128633.1 Ferrous iron transport permease EfeU [Candidatus Hydrogenisulfobacillus filiaventi]